MQNRKLKKHLKMKYLLVEGKGQREQMLLDNIADFLWNNGNEIYVRASFDNEIDYQNILDYCDCIVFLICRDCPIESLFARVKNIQEDTKLRKSLNKKFILAFSINGVYFNAMPFPHKIFHFEGLYQHELTRFFHWCAQLNLFTKSASNIAYKNIPLF